MPESRYLLSERTARDKDTSDESWNDLLDSFLEVSGALCGGQLGSVVSADDLVAGRFGRVDRIFVDGADRSDSATRPAGYYAVYYHQGGYDSIPEAYPRLLAQIDELGQVVSGDAYESYLIAEMATRDPGEHITKITIPVRPKR